MKLITKDDISAALKEVGVYAGQSLMVHTSLRKIGYVCGGAQTVIEAQIEAVGEFGTIMMPTQSWKNLDPEDGVHDEVAVEDWQIIRDNWPAYDKQLTPTNTMGAVAEMFRSWPGTIRSDHPARSVSAWGRHAAYLTENHDLWSKTRACNYCWGGKPPQLFVLTRPFNLPESLQTARYVSRILTRRVFSGRTSVLRLITYPSQIRSVATEQDAAAPRFD